MNKRKIIITVLGIVILGLIVFLLLPRQKIITRHQPSKPVSSTWLLPSNDGIGEASLFLYKDDTFELISQDGRRFGNWEMRDIKTLQLKFTDNKQKYDQKTNIYFENTKVLDPYTLELKIIKKPAPYLDFFNYFFYKK